MKFYNHLPSLIVLALVVACAPSAPKTTLTSATYAPTEPKVTRLITIPLPNEIARKEVGETLVEQVLQEFPVGGKPVTVGKPSLQKNLVYTGRSGKTIHLSYREFQNDYARPAFTQDLTFDISSDRVVGFRGARIEITFATNTAIQYKVLQGFSDDASATSKGGEIGRVVCKRRDGRVETLGPQECAQVGYPL
jgi:hypothetical protein